MSIQEAHSITTEAIEPANGPYAWKLVCSCGWTCYCQTAEATQAAIYEHRAELMGT